MTNTKPSAAVAAAIAHFEQHEVTSKEIESIKAAAFAVADKLDRQAAKEKPDFAEVSKLHFERQHLVDRLNKAERLVKELEVGYQTPGERLYNEANRLRDVAGQAALACISARLSDDFSGGILAKVVSYHPAIFAEDERRCFVLSPRDVNSFQAFANTVPGLLKIMDQSRRRIEIYEKCTATRGLPSQAELEAATPEEAKPVLIKPRRELTDEERDAPMRRLRELVKKGCQISRSKGHGSSELAEFVQKHPEAAPLINRLVAA